MTKILLSEFNNYNKEDLFDFIKIQNGAFYEVLIPKRKRASIDDDVEVAQEYMNAAYIGQKLSDLSVDFMHNVPEPEQQGEFSFIIMTTKKKRLANFLYFIAQALFNEETEDWLKLDAKSTEYFVDLPNDIACTRYIEMLKNLDL
jgi:hypothetical protein